MLINLTLASPTNWIAETYCAIQHLSGKTVVYLRRVSNDILNTPFAKTASVLTFNLLLIKLSDKLAEIACRRFHLDPDDSFWIEIGKWGGKSVIVISALSVFNHAMNGPLSRIYIISTAIASVAAQLLWQKWSRSPVGNDPIPQKPKDEDKQGSHENDLHDSQEGDLISRTSLSSEELYPSVNLTDRLDVLNSLKTDSNLNEEEETLSTTTPNGIDQSYEN